MRIAVHSDLHFEYDNRNIAPFVEAAPPADVLVLAGDCAGFLQDGTHNFYEVLAPLCAKFADVIYVIGNHDLWDADFKTARAALDEVALKLPNLHVLDNGTVTIDGQRFVGATMFFPFDMMNQVYEKLMNDFWMAKNFRENVYAENEVAVRFLNETVMPGDIVVTHHMPTYRSVHPMFRGSELNRFFICDMERLITAMAPAVWVHGHTHFTFDFMLDQTRIVCNPRGYPHALNREWKADFALEIG